MTISFELPKRSCDHRGKYSDISFFLSKKNTEDEIARSHIREDIDSSQQIGNIYIDSDCDKWEHYQIDFHQGYYHNNVSFTKISPG